MPGYAVDGLCYREPAEAAAVACSGIAGPTAAGVVSCDSPAVVSGVLTYTLNVDDAAGRSSRVVSVPLRECDPFDLETHGASVEQFFVALVCILAIRLVYTRVFGTGLPSA
jgi:hypothetical protein